MRRTLVTSLALAGFSATALAGPLTATTTPTSLTLTKFAYGSATVHTSISGNVGAGELLATVEVNGQQQSFLTYCTEIDQSAYFNTRYTSYSPSSGAQTRAFTAAQADRLGKLYTLAGTDVDTADESAAFQISVWEIVHESALQPLNLTQGSFFVDATSSANALALASQWLTAISSANAASSFTATRLFSPEAQDFVIFTANPGAKLVPEPGSFALAGLALAGLLATRRRRS